MTNKNINHSFPKEWIAELRKQYLLFISLTALSLVITKFVANLKGKRDLRGVSFLFHYFNRQLLYVGIVVAIIIALVSPWIISFLHLDSAMPVILIGFL